MFVFIPWQSGLPD